MKKKLLLTLLAVILSILPKDSILCSEINK